MGREEAILGIAAVHARKYLLYFYWFRVKTFFNDYSYDS